MSAGNDIVPIWNGRKRKKTQIRRLRRTGSRGVRSEREREREPVEVEIHEIIQI